MHKQICMHLEDILTKQIDLQCPLLFCLRHSASCLIPKKSQTNNVFDWSLGVQ